MRGFQTTGFVFTIIISVFDALIALYTVILSAILWGIDFTQDKVKTARFIFLYLLCFVLIHAVISIVTAVKNKTTFKNRKTPYLVFNTLLPLTGIGALAAFYGLYITYAGDFFGSSHDPDHRVVLPLVVLYCSVCAINLFFTLVAGLTWPKADQ